MARDLALYCKDCGIDLTDENGSFKSNGSRRNLCKLCYNARYSKGGIYYSKERIRTTALKYYYGVSQEQYNNLLKLQSNTCAICRRKCETGQQLSVDHDHTTNKIRGLLCKKCNLVVGHLEDEDYVWDVLEYMKKHSWSKTA